MNRTTSILSAASFLLITFISPLSAQNIRSPSGDGPSSTAQLQNSGQQLEVVGYILQVGDELSVQVLGEPEFPVRQRVDPNGTITIPMLARVSVQGLTLEALERLLTQRFIDEEYYRAPSVSVVLHTFTQNELVVLGQVKRPGTVTMPIGRTKLDIFEAIARAGDFTDVARLSDVTIQRRIPGQDGSEELVVDLRPLLEGRRTNRPTASFEVFAGDIIIIRERLF